MKSQLRSAQSLKTTLAFAFVALSVGALVASGVLQLLSTVQVQRRAISSHQELLARETAREVGALVHDRLGLLETAALASDPTRLSADGQQQLLERLLDLQPGFSRLTLVSPEGRDLARAARRAVASPPPAELLHADALRRVSDAGRYVSAPYADPAAGASLMVLAAPIRDQRGDFRGALAAEVDLGPLQDHIARLAGRAYVVDRQGDLVACSDASRALERENVSHVPAVREFVDDASSARPGRARTYRGLLGVDVIGAYVPLGTPDWAVVTELPRSDANRDVLRHGLSAAAITALLAALAAALGVFLARHLTVPLARLTEAAARVSGGEATASAPVRGPREIVELSDALNSMNARLARSLENLGERVSQVKRAEELRRHADDTLRALFEGAPLAVLVLDVEGRVLLWNHAAARMYGWSSDEVLGKALPTVDPADADAHRAVLRRVAGGDTLQNVSTRRRRRDGTWLDVDLSVAPLRDARGDVHAIASVAIDVTERLRTQNALRESEERLRQLAENVDSVFFVFDLGAGQATVSYLSPAFEKVWGRRTDEVLRGSLPWLSTVLPEDRTMVEGAMRRTIAGEGAREIEYRITHGDGTTRWIRERTTPVMDGGGRVTRVVGLADDVTLHKRAAEERAKLEAQLLQARKLESIGRLAGGVAHDFNNMLSVILGYAELTRSALSQDDPLLPNVQEIERAANRSRDITTQLLAFSRKQIIALRPVDLNALVGDTEKTLRRLIGEDIDLAFLPGANLWTIKADPAQVDQILVNLALNARDAMPHGGRLSIETRNASVEEAECHAHLDCVPGDYVLLTVSDDGVGMDKNTLSRIFEPFFTTKDVGRGTGLGLATAYGIVRQTGGFINVYSEPGQGTTFRIYLPRAEGPRPGRENADALTVVSGTGTILLVEDDTMVRKLAREMLEALGYEVLVAATPAAALSLCETANAPIDLLMTDIVMPGMSGSELRDRVAALLPGIPVLFMSSYTSQAVVTQSMLDDDAHFLSKPFGLSELSAKVRDALADR